MCSHARTCSGHNYKSGVSTIIVNRDVRRRGKLVDRVIVVFKCEMVFDDAPAMLLGDAQLVQRYIGL